MSYQTSIRKIPGKKIKEIMLFSLSTCVWCKKAKTLLNELGWEYSYVDVDYLFGGDREEAYEVMQKQSQGISFPTIIINNGEDVIVGFEEEKIKNLK